MNVFRRPLDRVEASLNSAGTPAAQTPCAHRVCGAGVPPVASVPNSAAGILPVSAGPRAATSLSVVRDRRAHKFLANFAALSVALLLAPLSAPAQDEPTLSTPSTPAADLAPAAPDLSAMPSQDLTPGAELEATFHVLQLVGFDADGTPEYEGVGSAEVPAELGIRLRFDACGTTGWDWAWEFGDGTMAWEPGQCSVTKAYGLSGAFTVTLHIYDANGLELGAPMQRTIHVAGMAGFCTLGVSDPNPPFEVMALQEAHGLLWIASEDGDLAQMSPPSPDTTCSEPSPVAHPLGITTPYSITEVEYDLPDQAGVRERYLAVSRGASGLSIVRCDTSVPELVRTVIPDSAYAFTKSSVQLGDQLIVSVYGSSQTELIRYNLEALLLAPNPEPIERIVVGGRITNLAAVGADLFAGNDASPARITRFSNAHAQFMPPATIDLPSGMGGVKLLQGCGNYLIVTRIGAMFAIEPSGLSIVRTVAMGAGSGATLRGNRLLALESGTGRIYKLDVTDPPTAYLAQSYTLSALPIGLPALADSSPTPSTACFASSRGILVWLPTR